MSNKTTRKLLADDLMNPVYIILQMQESDSSSSESLTSLQGKRMEHSLYEEYEEKLVSICLLLM